jgi:gliding motility-associated-like protein
MVFEGASVNSTLLGSEKINEYFNYFIGNDKTKWASRVGGFSNTTYGNLFDGINLDINSSGGNLKYVYRVAAGKDYRKIAVRFEGTDGVELNAKGDLIIKTSVGNIVDLKPYAYQIVNKEKVEVPCNYLLNGNILSYSFPKGYDNKKELFIDPTLIFSTYSGSTADNFGYSATYDSKGDAYAAGSVFGVGYPVTTGAYQMTYRGGTTITFTGGGTYPGDDIGITKYNSAGTQRLFSTYLGGFGQELPHSLIANSNDELYMLGTTDAPNYPTTTNAYDTTYNGGNDPGVFDGIAAHYKRGSDIVISRLSADGTQLLSSTFVGGSGNDGINYRAGQPYSSPGFLRHNYADEVRGEIDIDKNNNVYVASCTRSANFPRTAGSFQNNFGGGSDACVFKMDANLSTMIWSTTFGGSEDDAAYSVTIDNDENLYITGGTRSLNFPTTSGVVQTTFGGGEADGFIVHINKNGQQIFQSTYYGYGDYDQCYFVELDKGSNVYVLGQADNSGSNFIRNAAYNKINGGQFISKFSATLDTIIWSTSFGRGIGVTDISPTAFLVDVCNSVYACGWGSQGVNNIVGGTGGTTGLDVTPNAFRANTDGQDFYLMVLKDDASQLTYATFMGGNISEEHVDGGTSRFDKKGVVYQSVCAGCGRNNDFPTTPGAVSNTNNSNNCNNAIFKFNLDVPLCLANFSSPNACEQIQIQFSNQSTSVLSPIYQWFFGDGNSSTQTNPTHTYAGNGVFNVTLVVTDPGSCNGSDTITKQILVLGNSNTSVLPIITVCNTQNVQIGIPPSNDSTFTYSWTPSNTLSASNVSNPIASPTQTTTYQLLVSNGICIDTFFQTVEIFSDALFLQGSDVLCPNDSLRLSVTNTQPGQQLTYSWTPVSEIISGANTATPTVSPSQSTTYTVSVVNQIGCTFVDSIRIDVISSLPNVNAIATPDTIALGDTSQLSLTLSGSVVSVQWLADSTLSATDVQNPLAYPKETHTYFVEVTDSQGCRKRDSVIVYVRRTPCAQSNIYIPNAFSPNGDGKNDVLYVRGFNITEFYFAVYDRWGQKVFESKNQSVGWDGKFKNSKLDPAVFGYYLEGLCDGGEKFFKKGNVTLLR